MRHGGFLSSNGFFQTTEKNQAIEFDYVLNAIMIETLGDEVKIQLVRFDDEEIVEENLWIISPDDRVGIEGMLIKKIIIHNEAGVALKWQGLID